MSKFKSIYQFAYPKKEIRSETVPGKDGEGKDIKITKDVEIEVPYFFAIKRPSREQLDKAELFYSACVGEGLNAGLMSSALLAKRFINDGGIFTEKEKEVWAEVVEERKNIESKLEEMRAKPSSERTEEENAKYKELEQEAFKLNRELQDYEIRQNQLFENTAEYRARTRTLLWWQLELLYKQDGDNYKPVFPLDRDAVYKDSLSEFKERNRVYDELVESIEDDQKELEFWTQVFQKAIQIVTIWYYNRSTKPEEFDKLIKQIENPNGQVESKEDSEKAESPS